MKRVVVAAKAHQPWLADAVAGLAQEIGAEVAVISLDALELEARSTVPRAELAKDAATGAVAERIRSAGVTAHAEARSGPVVRGVLVFAEDRRPT